MNTDEQIFLNVGGGDSWIAGLTLTKLKEEFLKSAKGDKRGGGEEHNLLYSALTLQLASFQHTQ